MKFSRCSVSLTAITGKTRRYDVGWPIRTAATQWDLMVCRDGGLAEPATAITALPQVELESRKQLFHVVGAGGRVEDSPSAVLLESNV